MKVVLMNLYFTLTLSKTGWRQNPKIGVQNREKSTAPWSAAALVAETQGRVAAQKAAGSLPWIGVDDPPDIQHLQAAHELRLQETANFQLGGPGKSTGADDPRHTLQNLAWQTCGTWMMVTSCVTRTRCPLTLLELEDANAKVGAERTPQKSVVIYYVDDLGVAPLEWKIGYMHN